MPRSISPLKIGYHAAAAEPPTHQLIIDYPLLSILYIHTPLGFGTFLYSGLVVARGELPGLVWIFVRSAHLYKQEEGGVESSMDRWIDGSVPTEAAARDKIRR